MQLKSTKCPKELQLLWLWNLKLRCRRNLKKPRRRTLGWFQESWQTNEHVSQEEQGSVWFRMVNRWLKGKFLLSGGGNTDRILCVYSACGSFSLLFGLFVSSFVFITSFWKWSSRVKLFFLAWTRSCKLCCSKFWDIFNFRATKITSNAWICFFLPKSWRQILLWRFWNLSHWKNDWTASTFSFPFKFLNLNLYLPCFCIFFYPPSVSWTLKFTHPFNDRPVCSVLF